MSLRYRSSCYIAVSMDERRMTAYMSRMMSRWIWSMVHHRLSSPSDLRALSGSSDYGHALCEDRINFKLGNVGSIYPIWVAHCLIRQVIIVNKTNSTSWGQALHR